MFSEIQSYIDIQILNANSFTPLALFFLWLGGLLASLLPCVYPLYPITAGILGSRTAGKKWTHPLIYYFGLAFTYFVFGLVAGLTGGAFNSLLRYPETNLFFSYLLFLLALSSVELISLPFFSGNKLSTENPSYANSFILGMGAGVLSSPCVGPVVVTVLVQLLANQTEGIQLFSLVSTSVKMFFFGLGLGLPFLLIGVFGFALPKSGHWMRFIQRFLGLLILYFSYSYLEKATSTWGLPESAAVFYFLIWVGLLYAAYLFTDSTEIVYLRMKKALALSSFALLFFFALLYTISHQSELGQGNEKLSASETISKIETEEHGNLVWYRNKVDVWKLAKEQNKPVFIDFYADWCTNCKAFGKLTLNDSKFNLVLKEKAILWKVYDTDPIFEEFQSNPNYLELKIGLPFFLVLGPDGKFIFKSNDYLNTKGMTQAIESSK